MAAHAFIILQVQTKQKINKTKLYVLAYVQVVLMETTAKQVCNFFVHSMLNVSLDYLPLSSNTDLRWEPD
jgi:hypothetical protein